MTVLRPVGSVEEILAAFRELDAMVAVPMHVAILAAGQRCPTLVSPYEPKGEAFAEAAGLPTVAGGDADRLYAALATLVEGRDRVRGGLGRRIREMRQRALRSGEGIAEALASRV